MKLTLKEVCLGEYGSIGTTWVDIDMPYDQFVLYVPAHTAVVLRKNIGKTMNHRDWVMLGVPEELFMERGT